MSMVVRNNLGAVGNTVELLRALKEKAINAANDSNTDEDRATIQKEINQFIDQVDDNALTQFNGKYLVDGSKNYVKDSTTIILLNQSLSTNTTPNSALTDLKDRTGTSLGIQKTDNVTVSWIVNGKMTSSSISADDNTLRTVLRLASADTTDATHAANEAIGTNKYGAYTYPPNKAGSVSIISNIPGVDSQLSGLTVSILDQEGNVRKAANAAFEFKLLQRAENATEGGNKNMLNFQVGSEANQSISRRLSARLKLVSNTRRPTSQLRARMSRRQSPRFAMQIWLRK